MSFFSELKWRNVFCVAAAYAEEIGSPSWRKE